MKLNLKSFIKSGCCWAFGAAWLLATLAKADTLAFTRKAP